MRTAAKRLFILLVAAAASFSFCSLPLFSELRGRLVGVDLWVDSTTIHVPDVRAGGKTTAQFVVKNLTSSPMRLLGAQTSCYCTVIEDLPLDLAPGESRTLTLTITPSERLDPGEFRAVATLFYNGKRSGQSIQLTANTVITRS